MKKLSKVLIIGINNPSKLDNGKSVVMNGVISFLKQRYGEKNVKSVFFSGESNEYKDVLVKPGFFTQSRNILLYSLLLRKKAIQEAVFYSRGNTKRINNVINDVNPDLIIIDTIRIAQFIPENNKAIVYLDDLFSIRYEKMLEIMSKHESVDLNSIGNFGKFIPNKVLNLMKIKAVEKFLLRIEKNLVFKSEVKTAEKFQTLLINENEVNVLSDRSMKVVGINEIRPFLNLEPTVLSRRNKHVVNEKRFIFLGSMNIAHNRVSIIHFLETQMQNIITKIPDVKIVLIGKHAPTEVRKIAEKHPRNIEIKGFVECLEDEFSKATAMIAPLIFGTGVKLKVIDALSQGLPVISTDYGVEGIKLTHGENCIVENNLDNYGELMLQMTDWKKNQIISQGSYDIFQKYYSAGSINKHYGTLFNVGEINANKKK